MRNIHGMCYVITAYTIGILAIRVHALYGLNVRMKYFLTITWLVSTTCSISITVHQLIKLSRKTTDIY